MFLSEHWPWPIKGICKMVAMQGKNHLVRLQGGLLLVLLVHHLEGDVAGDGGGGGQELGDDGPVDVGRASNHCCWSSVNNWRWMREDFFKKAKSLSLSTLTPTFDHSALTQGFHLTFNCSIYLVLLMILNGKYYQMLCKNKTINPGIKSSIHGKGFQGIYKAAG